MTECPKENHYCQIHKVWILRILAGVAQCCTTAIYYIVSWVGNSKTSGNSHGGNAAFCIALQ